MASRNISVLFFAAIALLAILHFPSKSEAIEPTALLNKVCKESRTSYPICLKILMAHPKSLPATNIRDIAENALDKARRESILISDLFTGFLSKKDTNLAFKAAFENCAYLFKEAHVSLMLEAKSFTADTATLRVHSALDEATSCETALADNHVNVKSIAEKIKKWKIFHSIAYAAVESVRDSTN